MIPQKKKTPEEIAALREELGIAPATPETPAPEPGEAAPADIPATQPRTQPQAGQTEDPLPAPTVDEEPVIHLDLPPKPARPEKPEPKPIHSLRKHELPLAPAPAVTHRTALPSKRHDPRDVAQIRKREALAALAQPSVDPAAHLRSQTASPFLYIPGYLLAIAAAVSVYQRAHYITPAVLLAIATGILVFIALRKPRSRHHAALLFIVVFLTLAFGTLHYAPLFQNAP